MARKSAPSSRPLFSAGIAELERRFDEHLCDEVFLQTLLEELTPRRTDRAQALRQRVTQALCKTQADKGDCSASAVGIDSDFDEADVPDYDVPIDEPRGEGDEALDETESDQVDLGGVSSEGDDRAESIDPGSPATNEPRAILDAWIALEVLSPQTFDKPEDLIDGDRRRVAHFDQRPRLPWEDGGELARPNTRLFYQVVLGAIRMDLATESLLKAFGDRRPERSRSRALAALAVVMVDRQGARLKTCRLPCPASVGDAGRYVRVSLRSCDIGRRLSARWSKV